MNRFALIAAIMCVALAHAEGRYFSAIEDLPLAPGLEEAGPGFWFDDANGRIVCAIARGPVDPAQVRSFYLGTLPALGWSFSPGAGVEGELVFLRGRERLALTVSAQEGGAELQTRLFIRPAPSRDD